MASPVKPNQLTQQRRDDRAVAKSKNERYVRTPTTPREKAATAAVLAPAAAKPKVNAQTQAIRDDRAEAKGKGQVYKRSVPAGSAAAKTRAAMGVNEALMNRRLTIRTAAKKKVAAKAKADNKETDTKAPETIYDTGRTASRHGDTTAETTAPVRELTQAEKDRIARKKADAAAGK
jgi:hypothetical protein